MTTKKYKARRRKGEKAAANLAFVILVLFAVVFIIPLLWIMLSAFKVDMEIHQAGGFLFFPKTWTLDNLVEILNPGNKQLPVYRWFLNSILISGTHTILAIIIYAMSAYAYAKMNFKGKDLIFLSMLFLSSFPGIVNIIPLYRIMLTFGWLNGPLSLIVPGLSGVFNIFLIRQFMYAIPNELLESAKIDGAGEFRVFMRIVLPLCKPILTVVGLFTLTGNWNDFLWPSIAINDIDRLPLTAGLQLAKGAYGMKVARMSAVALVAIIPMVILFLFAQKHFVKGISLSSGVKG